jgi:hypothetical protein
MKTKVSPDGYAPQPQHADGVVDAIRVMRHFQSGLRQLCFGISAFIEQDQRTPQLEAHLAFLHEDEARYHAQEAAWLRNQYLPYDLSLDNAGPKRANRSRFGSSGSKKRKARPSYVSVVPAPYEE